MRGNIRGHRYPASLRISAFPVLLMAAVLISAAPAAAAGRIQFTLGFNASFLSPYHHTTGFEAGTFLPLWKKGGLHASVGFLEVGAHSGYDRGDAWLADIGVWKGFGPDKYPSIVFGGISVIISDAYEAELGGAGAHFGFCQECWFGKHFGIYGRAVLRIFLFGEDLGNELNQLGASLSAGAVLRF